MADELERLYQTMYASVVRFLYRKVWDQDRAEDLAQEVFIRAMAHRPEPLDRASTPPEGGLRG